MIDEIKKDLDAGMFNKICSNESTFLLYVQQKLFDFEKSVKEEFLKKIKKRQPTEGYYDDLENVAFNKGYNQCWEDVKDNAKNL